ncbi:HNH endonuclease [uncultured Flavobacterium sp.]|uniref:HNH endonuclease n=1 Tax=uncultured Flavobacterium sp. TaxID=165435 RepID=UPI00292D9EF3|nr:HNH endonuclease [uncultured Flavobacterium sp.]
MYYIKKLQFQELGSPTIDGKVSRGRYFLISKNTEDFFPPLSKTQLNDTIILPIIPPNSFQKVYCSFVYHNDKYHGSLANAPRNEYRLYLNSKIDPNRSYFKVSDIVVFSKYYIEEGIPIYKIDLFKLGDSNYEELNELINSSSLGGNHALYNGELNFIKSQINNLENLETIIPQETKEVVQKEQNRFNYSEIEETKGSNLFNSVSFRDFVLLGYQNKCAITNEAIFFDKLINLEAAHIMPKSHSGSFLPCNGIALSRDMHWAFDKGMFSINDEYRIVVHDDVKDTILNKYDNQKINLPIEDFFKPEKAFLKYHSEKIFGLFKHSGIIRSSQ